MTEFSYKELVQRLNDADKMSELRIKRSLELREALKEAGDNLAELTKNERCFNER